MWHCIHGCGGHSIWPISEMDAMGSRPQFVRSSPLLRTMGSTGWVPCYWCERWVWNAYVPDGPDEPLCGGCLGQLVDYGAPRAPAAVHHYSAVLLICLPELEGPAAFLIARFLIDPHRPGSGSRSSPRLPERALAPPRPPRRRGEDAESTTSASSED